MTVEASRRTSRYLAWAGALLCTVALVSYFTLSVKLPSLRDSAWLNLAVMAMGLALSVAAFVKRRSGWSSAGLALSAMLSVALVGFVFVLSNQLPPPDRGIAIGAAAPEFDLPDQNGRPVSLSDFHGDTLVLVFYRGFW